MDDRMGMRPSGRRRRWLLGGLLVLGMVAQACGDDGGSSSSSSGSGSDTSAASGGAPTSAAGGSTTAQPEDVDPNGVLRVAVDLTSAGGVNLDPVEMNQPTDFHIHYNIFDTLLRQQEDGSYEPGLAKEAVIVDPSTITVELHDGITFQDGTPLDAEAVKFSIERNAATNKVQTFRMAELGQLDTIEVHDPLNLTIRLKQPVAGSFYNLLAHNETLVVSPTAVRNGTDLNVTPVGAGPFMVESYERESLLRLVKWDGYFQADRIKLAGIDYVQVSAQNMVTALRSNTVDAAYITANVASQLRGGGVEVRSERSPNSVAWVSLQCDTVPALMDVRVRQALNYATDKEAINAAIFNGAGEPMSQMWTSDTPYFNQEIAPRYDHDVERAKQLLAEAGHADLSLTMAVLQGQGQRMAELLQAQWAEAGIDVALQPVANVIQEYYLDRSSNAMPTTQTRMWTDKITRNFSPGSTGHTCRIEDPEFQAKVRELQGFPPDSEEAASLWKELSAMLSDRAWGVFGAMGTVDNAWDPDVVGNPTWRPNQVGQLWPDVFSVYVKR